MKQYFVILLMIVIAVFGYFEKDTLLAVIEANGPTAIPVSIMLVGLLVFFPVIPYPLLAGLIGSIFGVWQGLGISLVGIAIGTLIMFSMARYGFQNWAQKTLEKYPKAKEYENLFNQNAFLGILIVRIIPVIPSPVVNILCGVSTVSWMKFLVASLIGKLPAVFIFTFAGSLFEDNKKLSFLIYGVYFVVIMLLVSLKIKRGQELNT
ncbi:TVP38/TMEM64 family protein [Bacillus sp. T33-2]|uniref:TVP38/TMEM64 family protein n=1 Tax=Bacillus sp. T33-2 TaxID=2054168 RepID=UPI000C78795E|nr:TVP38/TMEM64 family protein [Bacillus sp. T33-2]PLR99289.1 hypothetical protein CVD19_02955 [Bacillus sp. T33-2]